MASWFELINEEIYHSYFCNVFACFALREEIKRKYIICLCSSQTSKEEIIRWDEGKKWQIRMEGLRNKLKEKEKEADALSKQLNTLKEFYTK